jgi:hypothetical protein
MKGQDLRDTLAGLDRNAPVFVGEREVVGAQYQESSKMISLVLAPIVPPIVAKPDMNGKKDEVKK